ncbi:MAG: hypothetical protein ACR2MM_09310 [Flavobacteriaceae bacterium]
MKVNYTGQNTANKNGFELKRLTRWNVFKYYSFPGNYENAALTK